MDAFFGTYKRISVENEEAFLKATGIAAENLEAIIKVLPTMQFTIARESDGGYSNTINAPGMPPFKDAFKLGEEFTLMDPMVGQEGKITYHLEGSKLMEKRVYQTFTIDVVYEINGNKLTTMQEVGTVKSPGIWEKC